MADVGANPAQEEVLVVGLNRSLKNVASSILSSEKATFFSSPGEFRPESSRLVKIALADSSRWANLETLQIALELHNPDPNPLELLCQPRVRTNGQTGSQNGRGKLMVNAIGATPGARQDRRASAKR